MFSLLTKNLFNLVLDASGRHTWGLFSGSRYWIGASDQCRQMERDFIEISNSMKSNKSERKESSGNIPPFRVSVNAVRLKLNILRPGINGVRNEIC